MWGLARRMPEKLFLSKICGTRNITIISFRIPALSQPHSHFDQDLVLAKGSLDQGIAISPPVLGPNGFVASKMEEKKHEGK